MRRPASMKGFQPKAGDTLPDDDPGNPPGPDTTAEDPAQTTQAETAPMFRPSHRYRTAEIDFRGEKRSNAEPRAELGDRYCDTLRQETLLDATDQFLPWFAMSLGPVAFPWLTQQGLKLFFGPSGPA